MILYLSRMTSTQTHRPRYVRRMQAMRLNDHTAQRGEKKRGTVSHLFLLPLEFSGE